MAIGALAAIASAASVRSVDEPRVVIRAPTELVRLAAEVEAAVPEALARATAVAGRPVAADLEPIVVQIFAEESPEARSTPPWVAGFAGGRAGESGVVLLPGRAGGYPDRGLPQLLAHELTHVLVRRAARGHDVPRWFNEGLAMAAAGRGGLGDRARVAAAMLRDGELTLSRLDRTFAGGETAVSSAYALAGDVVRQLLAEHGEDSGARILRALGRGDGFAGAFRSVTGMGVAEFEADYWRNRTFWDRWVPILSSSALLWGAISFLALAAFQRRRARDRARLAAWAEEERLASAAETPARELWDD